MTAWTRTDDHGITVTFIYTPDQRGNATLTQQEIEGLMRTGGWTECDCHEPGTTTSWTGGWETGTWTCDHCGRKKHDDC